MHRIIALLAVGFALPGAIFGFPGIPGTSLLSYVWIFPSLYLIMMAMTLLLVATAAWPHLPMGTDWRKVAIGGSPESGTDASTPA